MSSTYLNRLAKPVVTMTKKAALEQSAETKMERLKRRKEQTASPTSIAVGTETCGHVAMLALP